MEETQLIKLLPWDSKFFGFNIGLLKSDDLKLNDILSIQQEVQKLNLKCLYWLANPSNPTAIQLAEAAGFRYMDVRLTLKYCQSTNSLKVNRTKLSNHRLRIAQSADLPILKAIARSSHHNTRFYADPNFSRRDCDRLYEVWIENSLAGYANKIFVAENLLTTEPDAYITCHLVDGLGKIGLVAVHPSARDQHIGSSLLQKALTWFSENTVGTVEVVTQWISQPAVNLYQKAGFRASNFQLWFHNWFQPPESGEK